MARETGLPTFRPGVGMVIAQVKVEPAKPVTRDSAALTVLTDLTKVKAVVAPPSISLLEAEQIMIRQGVRMLFVVNAAPAFEGLITDTDLHGEKPMRLVAERASHFDELTVADVMTGISSLDAIDVDHLKRATVGDLIATLERFGRNHLLVVERQSGTDSCSVCGIVSRAQIERQTGLVVQTTHIASTFAEVERALF